MIEKTTYLSKFLSTSGVCSRRDSATLIKSGCVKVNGKIINNPSIEVSPKDKILINGKSVQLKPADHIYLVMNKPKGCVTTTSDEKGRLTVMSLLPHCYKNKKIYPVGRLDLMSTGLLLLTNDGEFANQLSHPKFNVKKQYQVKLSRDLTEKDKSRLLRGVRLEDGPARFDSVYPNKWNRRIVTISLHSGKNRIVRRLFCGIGHRVLDLHRTKYGNFNVRGLAVGSVKKVKIRNPQ